MAINGRETPLSQAGVEKSDKHMKDEPPCIGDESIQIPVGGYGPLFKNLGVPPEKLRRLEEERQEPVPPASSSS